MNSIRIGTRTSTLATWQANKVSERLIERGYSTEIVGISSEGDQSLGGDLATSVGQFIHAVDAELLSNNIDIAVHSSKDVPVEMNSGIQNLAYIERGCTNDLLILPPSKTASSLLDVLHNDIETPLDMVLNCIPESGMVGTVSGRRQSFMLSQRPDIIPIAVRGQVETRLKRLQQGRVDGIILAEIGLRRLHEIGALEPWILQFGAVRISDEDWPTAPGQGSISVHCRSDDFDSLQGLREILNHSKSEMDVVKEREILASIGGGCLYPAGIKVDGKNTSIQISPPNWREIFCKGLHFQKFVYHGHLDDLSIDLPEQEIVNLKVQEKGPRIISTLNSERLAIRLNNEGIPVTNKPVLDLISKPNAWPQDFIDNSLSRSQWPYLVLTSPFAAKCAIEVAKNNPDLNRIQWLAIGEGTARACFQRGVTVSLCGKARNSSELIKYIDRMLERNVRLMVPRSNVASDELTDALSELGFEVESWVGYENQAKSVEPFNIAANDVLLLSSPSSARAWMSNSLPIPKNILCMGKSSLEEITSLPYFAEATVEVLNGPTAKYVAKWWKTR
ncbi:MAG: hydroxymethylbilane synthase [Candidatus Poseidoniales archaeon]|nr:MAG: hydroxymethylbilane synthase [Candidatus Poseidoniales archaeon]